MEMIVYAFIVGRVRDADPYGRMEFLCETRLPLSSLTGLLAE